MNDELKNSKIQEYVDMVVVESNRYSSNPGTFNYSQDNDLDDQIFQQLCNPNQYQKSNNCVVCKKQFSMLKGNKTCKFCGCSVCEECSPKRRADPKKKSEFVRICDICDEKYLRAFLSQEFKMQTQSMKEQTTRLEKENQEIKDILYKQQNEKLELERKYNGEKGQLDSQISYEDNKLQKQKQKLAQSKNEIKEIEDETIKIRNSRAAHEENISDHVSRISTNKDKLERMSSEIDKLSNKLKVTLDDLANENQNLTSYQLNNRKGMDSILNSRMIQKTGQNRQMAKESTLTNQGYDDVFRSQNNNIDSVENYLIGLPQHYSKNQSFDINK